MRAMTQQDVESIIADAKKTAEPLIAIMTEIAQWSMPTATGIPGGWKITYSHESDPVYLQAKRMVEEIFADAQKKINE